MPSAAADMPVVEVDDRFHNLIPSRFPPVRPYERIADGRDDHFAAIECLTNPRLREKERLAGKPTPVDPESVRFQHWNHRSEKHKPELQSLRRISYAVFYLKTNNIDL